MQQQFSLDTSTSDKWRLCYLCVIYQRTTEKKYDSNVIFFFFFVILKLLYLLP